MKKKRDIYFIFIHILLFVLIVVNILFILQISKYKKALRIGNLEQISVGEYFDNIPLKNTKNEDELFVTNNIEKKTLIFIFSIDCHYCTENIQYWNTLKELYYMNYNIAAIGTDEIQKIKMYIQENNPNYKVYCQNDDLFRERYKIAFIPQTLLVNKKGKVEKIWLGAFSTQTFDSVKSYLSNIGLSISSDN